MSKPSSPREVLLAIPGWLWYILFGLFVGAVVASLICWGTHPSPSVTSFVYVSRTDHDFVFDGQTKCPAWVAQTMNPGSARALEIDATPMSDRDLPKPYQTSVEDFLLSGYVPGQLLLYPCALGKRGCGFLSTCCPMSSALYSGYWQELNRNFAKIIEEEDYIKCIVVTGPLFLAGEEIPPKGTEIFYSLLGPARIGIPSHFFRISFFPQDATPPIVRIVPNRDIPIDTPPKMFNSSVEEVARLSGIIFPDDLCCFVVTPMVP